MLHIINNMYINEILINQYLLFNNYNQEHINFILNNNFIIYDKINLINFEEYIEILNSENIKWIFDDNNYKILYYDNRKVNFIKITDDKNIYDFISSNSLLPDNELICGENIQSMCDIVIGTHEKIIYNPNNSVYSKRLENIDCINDISIYKNIFVFTDNLLTFYEKFHTQLSNKNIVSHNSDDEINNNFIKYLDIVNCQLSQNCLIQHPKLISLPIGIENRQHFDHQIFHNIRKRTDIKKEKNIYFLFSLANHPSRNICYNSLINKIPINSNKSKEEYFIELKKHKFAICPRGNGLDTHRLWECLYLDVIPIMISSDFININNLPIIILNSWNDFNEEQLYKEFKNIKNSKVCLSYYKGII